MTDSMVRLRSDLAQRSFAQWMYGYVGVALVLLHTVDELSTLFGMSGLLQPAATLLGFGFAAAAIVNWFHGEPGRQRIGVIEAVALAGIASVALVAMT